ncbi:MAG: Non-ous end joining protein Ku [Paucimonas sp.]|nr:Non-ous end joining protein Ku [Paucimonas sp.]
MAARSLADLSLSFGLVSIPVKIYPATESKGGVSFNLLHAACGSRVRQQYICVKENVIVDRSEMVKGYEFAKDQYVVFEADELKALQEKSTHTVDIVAFIPDDAIDPVYYDKAYYLAPDKRGDRPYSLLVEGMKQTGRVALARWAWRGKSYTVQVRPSPEGGLVLQQLLYADEVRSIKDLPIPEADVRKAELDLAVSLIDQISQDSFDPGEYQDDEKKRIEAAVDQKVSGKQITVSEEPEHGGGQVIDLMEALRASLGKKTAAAPAKAVAGEAASAGRERKSAKRATPASKTAAAKTTAAKSAARKPARKTRAA